MKENFEEKLAMEFPFMRRRASAEEQRVNGGIKNVFDAFGYECGSGWYELLRSLCAEITASYKKAGLPLDIVVDQVKEKFGTLRFYYHPEGQDPGIHAFDVLGGQSLRVTPGNSEFHREIAEIVQKWEKQSVSICEVCGALGELRKDIGYRVQTLCGCCYTRKKQQIAEYDLKKRNKGNLVL